jgi:hypothetical protein
VEWRLGPNSLPLPFRPRHTGAAVILHNLAHTNLAREGSSTESEGGAATWHRCFPGYVSIEFA